MKDGPNLQVHFEVPGERESSPGHVLFEKKVSPELLKQGVHDLQGDGQRKAARSLHLTASVRMVAGFWRRSGYSP